MRGGGAPGGRGGGGPPRPVAHLCPRPAGLQNPIDTMFHLQPVMFLGLFPLFAIFEGRWGHPPWARSAADPQPPL